MIQRLLLAIFITLTFSACTERGPTSTNTQEEMFAAVIANPIPPEVTELQGVGDTWQGYQLFLRFTAPEATRMQLFEAYTPVPCDEVMPRLALPEPAYDKFAPVWTPQTVVDPACATAVVSNEWTYIGTHTILIEAATNEFYFEGIGG